jgi:hypothetical protein
MRHPASGLKPSLEVSEMNVASDTVSPGGLQSCLTLQDHVMEIIVRSKQDWRRAQKQNVHFVLRVLFLLLHDVFFV